MEQILHQTYHRVEYKRWKDVLPLTDEDAEEKWRDEEDWARACHSGLFVQAVQGTSNLQDWLLVSTKKVRKNSLLRGCLPDLVPEARAGFARGPLFVTAHRDYHCNECPGRRHSRHTHRIKPGKQAADGKRERARRQTETSKHVHYSHLTPQATSKPSLGLCHRLARLSWSPSG